MTSRVLIYFSAALLAGALVHRFHRLGGPYFAAPETIQDHVAVERYPSRDAIVLSRRAADMLPRGASVTVLMPSQAPSYDPTLWYTAVGLMPHHKVVAANGSEAAQFILAVREPLPDDRYRLVAEFAEGRIYERR